MSEVSIVTISGKQGSGKTTITEGICKAIFGFTGTRWSVRDHAFAAPLYDMHNFVRGTMKEGGFPPPEHLTNKDGDLLQILGSHCRRVYGANVFVEHLKNRIDKAIAMDSWAPRQVHVISDCRFKNELHAYEDCLRVRLVCKRDRRKARASMWRENENHESEVDLDDYESEGKFDLYLNTGIVSPAGCVDMIIAQLQKNNWMEKRK